MQFRIVTDAQAYALLRKDLRKFFSNTAKTQSISVHSPTTAVPVQSTRLPSCKILSATIVRSSKPTPPTATAKANGTQRCLYPNADRVRLIIQ